MLGGCSYLSSLTVYKLDINQGNYVTSDQVDRLKVGQTRQQVRTLLGTPLLTDAFHANRWDYPYEFNRLGRCDEGETIHLRMRKHEGDVLLQVGFARLIRANIRSDRWRQILHSVNV